MNIHEYTYCIILSNGQFTVYIYILIYSSIKTIYYNIHCILHINIGDSF